MLGSSIGAYVELDARCLLSFVHVLSLSIVMHMHRLGRGRGQRVDERARDGIMDGIGHRCTPIRVRPIAI